MSISRCDATRTRMHVGSSYFLVLSALVEARGGFMSCAEIKAKKPALAGIRCYHSVMGALRCKGYVDVERPRGPPQRYRITESGRAVLARALPRGGRRDDSRIDRDSPFSGRDIDVDEPIRRVIPAAGAPSLAGAPNSIFALADMEPTR